MLDYMDRNTIKALARKGLSKTRIAEIVGCHRTTVTRVLTQSPKRRYSRPGQTSLLEYYRADILRWLSSPRPVPVKRMLELVRELPAPYTGGKSRFYSFVREVKKELGASNSDVSVAFEGLPGEYLQIDWGESRVDFGGVESKRYFFCCRLKYSRFMYVEFHKDMKFETVVRSLIRCFIKLGGVPWQLVFDNMKTVTSGRDDQNRPIWNDRFKAFATEFDFSPIACSPRAGNQKGSVENLVKFVKSNFLSARRFHDDEDLKRECEQWLSRVNGQDSQAHRQKPVEVLAQEQEEFLPLPANARNYGFAHLLKVTPESMVQFQTVRYSVPTKYVGQTLVARIHEDRIRLYDADKLVADHARCFEKHKRRRLRDHYKSLFKSKPRAQIMLTREELMGLSEICSDWITELCKRLRDHFGAHVLKLWELKQSYGDAEFLAAIETAAEEKVYSWHYIDNLLAEQPTRPVIGDLNIPEALSQSDIDRDLACYDSFVRGGESS